MKKYLNLWEDVNGESRPFAEITLNQPGDLERLVEGPIDKSHYTVRMLTQDYEKTDFKDLGKGLTPGLLADNYLDAIRDSYELAKEIFPQFDPVKLYKGLLGAIITFATEEVYDKYGIKVIKDDGTVLGSSAVFRRQHSEVLVRISDCHSLKVVDSILKHELGHFLHQMFAREGYQKSNPIWLETLAIFFQQRLKAGFNFKEGTSHFKAAQLLSHLRDKTDFGTWNPRSQWHFLTGKTNEEEALDYINRNRDKIVTMGHIADGTCPDEDGKVFDELFDRLQITD